MELPRRERGDELLRPGEMAALRLRLRKFSRQHDLVSVIACAFDDCTRMIHTVRRIAAWGVRLMFRKIERFTAPPALPMPMRSVDGGPAAHDNSISKPEPLKLHEVRIAVDALS